MSEELQQKLRDQLWEVANRLLIERRPSRRWLVKVLKVGGVLFLEFRLEFVQLAF